MSKGWEFFWEGGRYCVGATDAPTARKYLRAEHLVVAQRRECPTSWPMSWCLGLQLRDGTVRVMIVGRVKD